jgi:hypothetical protein
MRSNITRLALLVLLAFGLTALAQETPQQPQQPQQQPTSPASPTSQQPGAQAQPGSQQSQSFSGTISKSGDNYVLQDEATKTSYTLDNSEQAKQYVGKPVRVSGTLDPSTNMIHVDKIELVSPSGGK